MAAAVDTLTPKARRTRHAILAAAEQCFADHGFHATRLEDVAGSVGIRRASIVYYFRDKAELYDGVLADALGGLFDELAVALRARGTEWARIEAAVSTWVAYVGRRPTLARLILRESVDAAPGAVPALVGHLEPFVGLVRELLAERDSPPGIDPAHAASAIAGATLFFVGAMPTLVPGLGFDPVSKEHLEAHRREVLEIARRLLDPDRA